MLCGQRIPALVLHAGESGLEFRLHPPQGKVPTAVLSLHNLGLPLVWAGPVPFMVLPFPPVSRWFLPILGLNTPVQVVIH